MFTGDGYGRSLRGREKARETERDTSNRAFWGGKSRFGTESEREREGERVTSNQAFWGEKTPIWDREGMRERVKDRERERSFLGWRDSDLGQRGRERERHREMRQIKPFGVERQQFGTEKKGERERDTKR